MQSHSHLPLTSLAYAVDISLNLIIGEISQKDACHTITTGDNFTLLELDHMTAHIISLSHITFRRNLAINSLNLILELDLFEMQTR